jgi:hypothetical protein
VYGFVVDVNRRLVPCPAILKRLDLRSGLGSMLPEQHIVIGTRIERRIEVDEIHRFGVDMLPEDLEVVAVVEKVRLGHSL